ncbi:AAA family ATPase [Pedobacter sp. Leaf250]|uniref:AAA family ATPase n=1 Tax=Pedobacter sp. Leaf250 TaxID=2876559 RepID=UPI001E51E047|nr:AAA family ATPase [Pedobacter sp. Leaf250]
MSKFYKRERELEILNDIYRRLNGPQIISLTGLSGTGKTRLVQEFYNNLAKDSQYWLPSNITTGTKEIELLTPHAESQNLLEWLILSSRSNEAKGSKYDFSFDRIRHQFSYHLPEILKMIRNKEFNKKITKSAIGVILNFSLPGSGGIIELINIIKDSATNSADVLELINEITDRLTSDSTKSQNEFYAIESNSLIESTVNVFTEIFNKNKSFKIIIYLEDFHWVDAYTLEILKALFQQAEKRSWNIIFLLSHWPEHVFNREAQEFKILQDFKSWQTDILTNRLTTVPLVNLAADNLFDIVRERLPNVQHEAIKVLVNRSKGDIDLLNDFVDEITQSIGWLSLSGELLVSLSELKKMPAKTVEMAKSRLLSYPNDVRNHLAWSAVQGINFDFQLISDLLEEHGLSENYFKNLYDAEERFGIIDSRENTAFKFSGEFKRAVFFEACSTMINKHPSINDFKKVIVRKLNNFINTADWDLLSDNEKSRIMESFTTLCDSCGIQDEEVLFTRIENLIRISKKRLLIGDANKAIEIAEDLLGNKLNDKQLSSLYSIISEAYYHMGNNDAERQTLDKWKNSSAANSYKFDLKYSNFLLRRSQAEKSIEYMRSALRKAYDDNTKIHALNGLVKSLWANGNIYPALIELENLQQTYRKTIQENLRLNVEFNHSACLVLHDLDKNKQLLQHAESCISTYEKTGDIQSLLLSKVNHADALWAIGYYGRAIEEFKSIIEINKDYDLPHVEDITLICYANVLSTLGKYEEAAELYDRGLALAKKINHDWDYLYGKIYSCLNNLKAGMRFSASEFKELIQECKNAQYHYLSELAFAVWCVNCIANQEPFNKLQLNYEPQLPVGKLFYYAGCINSDLVSDYHVQDFMIILGKCEGIKVDRNIIAGTITVILNGLFKISEIQKEFLIRWLNSYSSELKDDGATRLVECDYLTCEARCCYDGVYLHEQEADDITRLVMDNPMYFQHLPTDFIVQGTWSPDSGKKTAVRSHQYSSPDFPEHFEKTRCVFAYQDGACSLQRLSMETTENAWTYKPKACRLHPLQSNKGEFIAPPTALEDDKYNISLRYPGYVSYTPCGINRNDGEIWFEMLSKEIESLG